MNNLDAILEIAIGLVLTWLILSVATAEMQDIINSMLNRRAKFLEESILDMFRGEKDFVDAFYEHPAIKALYKKGARGKLKKPDYIPNAAFAEAAFEVFVNLGVEEKDLKEDDISVKKIISQVEEINNRNPELGYFVRRIMPDFEGTKTISKLKRTEAKAVELKNNAEVWFDTAMTRASFLYKEKAKTAAFIIGFIFALSFNVDSIYITQELWREPTLRQSLVAQAQTVDENTGHDSVTDLEKKYADLKIPVGWETQPVDASAWFIKIVGLLISGLAAMQGAPFWFDLLKKLLRLSGKEDKSSTPPASQPPAQTPGKPPVEAVG